MAGASFNWNGHQPSGSKLLAHGPSGLPFSEENEFHLSERYVEILTRVMNDEVEFYKITPQSDQLTAHDPFRVFALAEEGRQYMVFSIKGEPFSLFAGEGEYSNNVWIDTRTGEQQSAPDVTGHGALEITPKGNDNRHEWPPSVSFKPPSTDSDWVLILRE
jgi:hypothetical protein